MEQGRIRVIRCEDHTSHCWFEDGGRGPWVKACGQLLEAGRGPWVNAWGQLLEAGRGPWVKECGQLLGAGRLENGLSYRDSRGSASGSEGKKPPATQAPQETWVRSLGQEDPLEKEMSTHFSILAWEIPRSEEPGRLQSIGCPRIWHDWSTYFC